MSRLFQTLRFIIGHPLNRGRPLGAIVRVARWQVRSRLRSGPVAVPFVGNTRLLVRRGMTGATGNIYCGLHEFEDMGLALHALRPGDLFVDVGANVGSYTVLAAGASRATVLAIEPHPGTCSHLIDNVRLNGLEERVTIRCAALGAAPGVVRLSADLDTTNHVLAGGRASSERGLDTEMTTLDEAVGRRTPLLIKIDVEGYETEVLRGASTVLQAPSLQAVLLELNGSGARYGFDEAALHDGLVARGFTPCAYDPFDRRLAPIPRAGRHPGSGNTLYVRDVGLMQERVRSAPRYRVHGREL